MILTGVAVLIGLMIGVALPARRQRFARPKLRALPVLALGVVVQVIATGIDGGQGLALVLAAYGALLAFAFSNIHVPGTGILALGLAMNALVIAVNGSMPVHPAALVDAGVITADEVGTVSLSGHRHLEKRDDWLTFLDDRIPLPLGAQVISFGDLVLAVAAADVVAHIARRRRQQPGAHAIRVIDLRHEHEHEPPHPAPKKGVARPKRVLEEVGA